MKANKLMIGDLVYYTINNGLQIGTVYNIFQRRVDIKPNNKTAILCYDDDILQIEPIPLTTEILEKNGFMIKKKWAQIGNFGNSPLIMWHFEDDPILHDFKHELEIHQNDTGKVQVKIPCEYVHQLQHALRLCGINEEITL